MDGFVPYLMTLGNHDQDNTPSSTANYNAYFPSSRFDQNAWYGGHYGGNNDNSYTLFEAAGMKFMAIKTYQGDAHNNRTPMRAVRRS